MKLAQKKMKSGKGNITNMKYRKWTLKKIKEYISVKPTCYGWFCEWLLDYGVEHIYDYSKTKSIDMFAHYIKEHLANDYYLEGTK